MFKEMLDSVIERTEGSLGALIMGTDGIAVEKVFGEAGMDANLDVAAAEFTTLAIPLTQYPSCNTRRRLARGHSNEVHVFPSKAAMSLRASET